MDFGDVIHFLKQGFYATREGWASRGMWIKVQYPDEDSKMGNPYIYMKTDRNSHIPWIPSYSDMLSDDWILSPTEEGLFEVKNNVIEFTLGTS